MHIEAGQASNVPSSSKSAIILGLVKEMLFRVMLAVVLKPWSKEELTKMLFEEMESTLERLEPEAVKEVLRNFIMPFESSTSKLFVRKVYCVTD